MLKQVIITNPESTRTTHKYARPSIKRYSNITYPQSHLHPLLKNYFTCLNSIHLTAVSAADLLAQAPHEKHLLEALLAYYHTIYRLTSLLGSTLLAEEVGMSGRDGLSGAAVSAGDFPMS